MLSCISNIFLRVIKTPSVLIYKGRAPFWCLPILKPRHKSVYQITPTKKFPTALKPLHELTARVKNVKSFTLQLPHPRFPSKDLFGQVAVERSAPVF